MQSLLVTEMDWMTKMISNEITNRFEWVITFDLFILLCQYEDLLSFQIYLLLL